MANTCLAVRYTWQTDSCYPISNCKEEGDPKPGFKSKEEVLLPEIALSYASVEEELRVLLPPSAYLRSFRSCLRYAQVIARPLNT